MGTLIFILTIFVIWKISSIIEKKFLTKRPHRRIKPIVKKKLNEWISDAKDVIRNPDATEKEIEDALIDIDVFSKILNKVE